MIEDLQNLREQLLRELAENRALRADLTRTQAENEAILSKQKTVAEQGLRELEQELIQLLGQPGSLSHKAQQIARLLDSLRITLGLHEM